MGKTNKYFRSVFSIKPIATFSVIAMILAGVFYLNMTSNTGKLWGIERSTVYTIIYALVGLTLISIYYFNVKKSGWLLAIISLIIQPPPCLCLEVSFICLPFVYVCRAV